MARRFYHAATGSDLTGGADFNSVIRDGINDATGTATVSIANATTETSYWFSEANSYASGAWNWNYDGNAHTVSVEVTTANTAAWLSVSLSRIDSTGTVLDTSPVATEQQLSTTGQKTFSITKAWGATNTTDRLRVDFMFRSTQTMGGSISVSMRTGSTTSILTAYVDTPAAQNQPPTIATNTPDVASFATATPAIEFTATDTESNDVRYNVQIDTVNTFDSQGSASLLDSYSESNMSLITTVGRTPGRSMIGQSFVGNGAQIYQAIFYIRSTNGLTSDVYAKIYATTGTHGVDATPTGSAIATSDPVSASRVPSTTSLVAFTFSGANKITLSSGTTYIVVFQNPSTTTIEAGYDNSSPTHLGNWVQSVDSSSSWFTNVGLDLIFYLKTGNEVSLLNKTSGTDTGFVNTVNGADTDPFTSGQKVSYTAQSALANGTYYWRARAIDPAGSNTYSAWTAARSFTVSTGGGGGTTGQIKVHNGASFVAKPVKVWNGSAWVTKPLKRWNGSAWVTTTY